MIRRPGRTGMPQEHDMPAPVMMITRLALITAETTVAASPVAELTVMTMKEK